MNKILINNPKQTLKALDFYKRSSSIVCMFDTTPNEEKGGHDIALGFGVRLKINKEEREDFDKIDEEVIEEFDKLVKESFLKNIKKDIDEVYQEKSNTLHEFVTVIFELFTPIAILLPRSVFNKAIETYIEILIGRTDLQENFVNNLQIEIQKSLSLEI